MWGALSGWRWRAAWAFAGAVVVTVALVVPLPLGPIVVRMQGSNTIGSELAPDLVLGFLRSRAGGELALGSDTGYREVEIPAGARPLRFDIGSAGSDTAFECGVDIGMSSRPIEDDEQERLEDCGGDRQEIQLASDAVAVVAHPDLGLAEISLTDLRRVFTCEVRDWSDLDRGLPAGPITLLRRNDDSGTADVFRTRVLNTLPICLGAVEFEDSQELSERVAQTPGAIGFVGLPFVGANTVPAISGAAGAVAVAPTEDNVRSGLYPLARPLYLYVVEEPPPVVREFLDYVRGCAGQQRVDDDGFFRGQFLACEVGAEEDPAPGPAAAGIAPTPCPQGAPVEYCEFVDGAARLPFAVRFDTASGAVDSGGRQDLVQLVEFLRGLGLDRQVLVVGFTDESGDPQRNDELSLQRARAVESELRAMGVAEVAPVGLGERYLVDDDSPAGQQRNRRVEVWVR